MRSHDNGWAEVETPVYAYDAESEEIGLCACIISSDRSNPRKPFLNRVADRLIDRANTLGVVLCGGQSKRFGSPKPFFVFRGRRLVDAAVSLMGSVFDNVCLAVGDDLTSDWPDVPLVRDQFRGIGPMGGIHAALGSSEKDWSFVMAVDLPEMTSRAVLTMMNERRDGDLAVVAIDAGERIHPLFGLYNRSILPHIESAIERGEYGPTRLLAGLSNIRYVTLPDDLLRNTNRKEDLSEN